MITGRWSSRVVELGSDSLGRWVWVTLRGQQRERLTVVLLYQPNPGGTNTGPTMVWAQQQTCLQEIANDNNNISSVDPRSACLRDFASWAKDKRAKGDKIVVMANANQSLADTIGNYNLKDLVTECKLQRTMESVHPRDSLQSTNRSSKTIDHILAAGIERNNITQAGHLPFGLGFHTDHRGVFADMDGDNLMRIVMEEPKTRKSRRLSSKNGKHRVAYLL